MGTEQIAVRVPEDLLVELDELVAQGAFESRAAAVRVAIELLTAAARSRAVDRAVVDGYRRTPPTPAEGLAALASMREAIAEEPW